ncbi:MAG: hypothetical protein EOO07_07660 [Chitinophagaceae bacterium]|nr:MAG: hypothetical protein EOO07_07660 [Chitinophagaceae bacterium]
MNATQNLSQVLFNSLSVSKNADCFTLVNKDLTVHTKYTNLELLEKSMNVAKIIQNSIPEDRLILACISPADFTVLFLAGIFCGKVIIPSLVPKSEIQFTKLLAISKDCGTSRILCDDKAAELIDVFNDGKGSLSCTKLTHLVVETFSGDSDIPFYGLKGFEKKVEDVAYVQYSSGSYSDPKGVALSHQHILSNLDFVAKSWKFDADTILGIWLPLYHDMGLASLVCSLIKGCRLVAMLPLTFVQKPVRWLQMITNYRVTVSGAPPFAYDLCSSGIKEIEKLNLDLSSWKCAFMGAEIVKRDVLDNFCEAFKNYGFDKTKLFATYGMAETTCYVCGSNEADTLGGFIKFKDEQKIRPCSIPLSEVDSICIVDTGTGKQLPEGIKGEIYFTASGIGYGYVKGVKNDQLIIDSTQFNHHFDTHGKRRWFGTGDIGIKKGNALWVLGRKKDMFKVFGENLLAVDVEMLAATIHPNLNAYGAAAFRINHDEDNTANLLIESYDSFDESIDMENLVGKIKTKIFSNLGLKLNHVLILKRGSLERTSSGKIKRNNIGQNYSKDKYFKKIYAG